MFLFHDVKYRTDERGQNKVYIINLGKPLWVNH